ncbi:unnamed protein product [Musa acuminata subsp. malaccensis]|uniref:(wild Malaysian banana) hypothetical protein n=1 Tax=Musa acuminata subsp. malaccensis TaxID=214687 RepID=A0A804ITD9_MUSAM|nr:unnamed protein product [Musa acuminata subsp. malaccensis]
MAKIVASPPRSICCLCSSGNLISGKKKQRKPWCTATGMASLVLQRCSTQHKPPPWRVSTSPFPSIL